MELTVKELKRYLEQVPDNSIIRFQWIEERYIRGRYEVSYWKGKEEKYPQRGWTTFDMPCDAADENCGGNNMNKELWKCPTCDNRNRYIVATKCFIKDDMLFIDGHD